jgi:methylmalonyl-CoA/ethylmalonyl-CoA epimerase
MKRLISVKCALIGSIFTALLVTASMMVPAEDSSAEGAETEAVRPIFTGISEVIMVVKDLDASVKKQWEVFGIGPWAIWTFDSSNVKDMILYGERENFSIRIAYTKIGETYWELVQPLDEKSTYYRTLKEKGEGLHNIVFDVEDYDQVIGEMRQRGIGVYNGGDWQGVKFTNFDTRGHLPVIAEIFQIQEGASFPPPEETYP